MDKSEYKLVYGSEMIIIIREAVHLGKIQPGRISIKVPLTYVKKVKTS